MNFKKFYLPCLYAFIFLFNLQDSKAVDVITFNGADHFLVDTVNGKPRYCTGDCITGGILHWTGISWSQTTIGGTPPLIFYSTPVTNSENSALPPCSATSPWSSGFIFGGPAIPVTGDCYTPPNNGLSIVVNNVSIPAMNGTYTNVGTSNGKDRYCLNGDCATDGSYQAYWTGIAWRIERINTGWVVIGGAATDVETLEDTPQPPCSPSYSWTEVSNGFIIIWPPTPSPVANMTITGDCIEGVVPTLSLVDADGDGVPEITDPCSCGDPQNITDGTGITYFHDFIEITSAPGETWEISAYNSGGLYLSNGTLIPLGTAIPEISPGVYYIDVWHPDSIGFDADFARTAGGGPYTLFESNACNNSNCTNVPTLSEWGIILFSLLLLSIGSVVLVLRTELSLGRRTGTIAMNDVFQNLPFQREVFMKMLFLTGIAALVLGIATFWIYGSLASVDILGTLLAGPLFAYLIHLFAGLNKGE